MPKFRYAFSPESQTELEPEDVKFSWKTHGTCPTLLCADEACRQEEPRTRLTAVACTPGEHYNVAPYFRTYPNQHHSNNCRYAILGEYTDYILDHKREMASRFPDANIIKEIAGIETDMLPDEFVLEFNPRDFIDEIDNNAQNRIRKGISTVDAYRQARCAVPQKTSKLELIVDMAFKLDQQGMRSRTYLSLPGRRKATYENAFFPIEKLKYDFHTTYIYCGNAIIAEYEDTFVAFYTAPLAFYHENYPNITAITPIPKNTCRERLQTELHKYAKSKEIISVYSFSTQFLNEKTCPFGDKSCCVVISPRARDCIVIRKRCLKKGEKSTT